jgi:hypothetical protein
MPDSLSLPMLFVPVFWERKHLQEPITTSFMHKALISIAAFYSSIGYFNSAFHNNFQAIVFSVQNFLKVDFLPALVLTGQPFPVL